jgi:uncharacterized protein (DUF1778 family)
MEDKGMTTKTATFPLRLPVSLKEAVEKFAREDGTSMNQFLVVAAAEKLSALQTEAFFAEYQGKSDMELFRRVLTRPNSETPRAGDEIRTDSDR